MDTMRRARHSAQQPGRRNNIGRVWPQEQYKRHRVLPPTPEIYRATPTVHNISAMPWPQDQSRNPKPLPRSDSTGARLHGLALNVARVGDAVSMPSDGGVSESSDIEPDHTAAMIQLWLGSSTCPQDSLRNGQGGFGACRQGDRLLAGTCGA